ncbi:MAG: response regulator transcription factor [Anaerolineales bacterium]|nr:response regulator transcription factor [Anaerolineales bacterium]
MMNKVIAGLEPIQSNLMEPAHILVIEDDDIVARTIERSLRGSEFRVTLANSGVEGLKAARRRPPDLVVLDIIMPGMDGYTVCREMRADPILAELPILFLTAKVKDEDKIIGFTAGADDYLTKPFNIDELILRLRAILRRSRLQGREDDLAVFPPPPAPAKEHLFRPRGPDPAENSSSEPRHRIAVAGYILDTRSYELYTPSRGKVRLTPVQYDLLHHLMRHPGEIFSPGRLLDEVWDYPSDTGSPDLVRVHIKNLRERIEDDPRAPQFIRTVPGYGYTIGQEMADFPEAEL